MAACYQWPNVIQWTFDPGIWDHHIVSKRRALYLRRTETSAVSLCKLRNSFTPTLYKSPIFVCEEVAFDEMCSLRALSLGMQEMNNTVQNFYRVIPSW